MWRVSWMEDFAHDLRHPNFAISEQNDDPLVKFHAYGVELLEDRPSWDEQFTWKARTRAVRSWRNACKNPTVREYLGANKIWVKLLALVADGSAPRAFTAVAVQALSNLCVKNQRNAAAVMGALLRDDDPGAQDPTATEDGTPQPVALRLLRSADGTIRFDIVGALCALLHVVSCADPVLGCLLAQPKGLVVLEAAIGCFADPAKLIDPDTDRAHAGGLAWAATFADGLWTRGGPNGVASRLLAPRAVQAAPRAVTFLLSRAAQLEERKGTASIRPTILTLVGATEKEEELNDSVEETKNEEKKTNKPPRNEEKNKEIDKPADAKDGGDLHSIQNRCDLLEGPWDWLADAKEASWDEWPARRARVLVSALWALGAGAIAASKDDYELATTLGAATLPNLKDLLERLAEVQPPVRPTGGNQSEAATGPLRGIRRAAVGAIANLAHQHRENQDLTRTCGLLPLVLNASVLDDANPFVQQWAIMAVRMLTEDNQENQAALKELTKTPRGLEYNKDLLPADVTAELSDEGRVRFRRVEM